jgi:hypothetical protein
MVAVILWPEVALPKMLCGKVSRHDTKSTCPGLFDESADANSKLEGRTVSDDGVTQCV